MQTWRLRVCFPILFPLIKLGMGLGVKTVEHVILLTLHKNCQTTIPIETPYMIMVMVMT